MADRSVVVRLVADTAGYITSIGAASAATKDFGINAALAAEKHSASWKTVGTVTAVAGAALVAIGVASIAAAAEFDKAMSTVRANVDDKSAPAMNRLRDAALEAGRTTVFSATEAADAENELAKAGISAADIVGGALNAALTLASAGQLDLATAAEITSSTMTQFGLHASDAAHIADVLAAGADKSLGGVTDLAEGLKYSGVAASQFGVSLDDTVGVLADFAANGILGSMAGTSLRQMLIQLANPSREAASEIQQLGLQFFDANGKFLGMANLAEQLKTKLAGLSDQQREQALATIFGSRSLAEANILYKDGAAGVEKWSSAVNDSGFAQQQANEKLNNLSGDLTKFKNSLNAAMIEAGESAQGPLRSLAQGATNAVNAFSNLPSGVQSAVLAIGTGAGAVALAVGGFITLSVKIGETVKAFQELQIASKLAFLTGPLGIAIGAAAIAFGLFATSQMNAAASSAELRSTLDQTTGAITNQTKALVANRIGELLTKPITDASGSMGNLAGVAKDLGISYATLTDAALGNADATSALQAKSADLESTIETLAAKHGDLTDAEYAQLTAATDQKAEMDNLLTQVLGTTAGLDAQVEAQKIAGEAMGSTADATKTASDAAKQNAAALDAQKQAADDAVKANDALLKSLTALQDLTLGARGAERDFAAAVDAASKAVKDNGANLDINTEKGRSNQAALDGIASSALKNVEATFKNRDATTTLTAAVGQAEAQVNTARAAFVQHAVQMGMDQGAAGRLADQLGLTTGNVARLSQTLQAVPGTTNATVNAQTSVAETNAQRVAARLDALDGRVVTSSVVIGVKVVGPSPAAIAAMTNGTMGPVGFAAGGYTGDVAPSTIAGVVHGQEYVLGADATARLGRPLLDALNSGQVSRLSQAPKASTGTATMTRTSPVIGEMHITAADPRAAVKEVNYGLRQAFLRMGES